MIIVIGLGLAGSAVTNAGLVADGNWKNALVAVVTFLIAAFINTKEKASYESFHSSCHYRWLPLRTNTWFGWTLHQFLKLTGLKSWFLLLPFSTGGCL